MKNKIIVAFLIAFLLPFAGIASVSVDTTKAVKIAKKAQKLANSGNTTDIEKAKDLYLQAADQGLKSAQRWLANYYWSQTPPMVSSAMLWEDVLAKQGDTASQYLLGLIYMGSNNEELGIDTNMEKGYYYMRMAAEQGRTEAQCIVGRCLMSGIGVAQDLNDGFLWEKKAADKGAAYAQYDVGLCYQDGLGCTVDKKKALRYLTLAAEQGHAEAQYALGRTYHLGEGVEKNLDDAIYWYTKSKEQGSSIANNNLAIAIEEKNGSSDESLFLLRKAAEEGDTTAQYNLGNRYRGGFGVTKSDEMADYWYLQSASKNFAPAQRELGMAYRNGLGVDVDEDKAFYWISRAAAQKDTLGVNYLGLCYEFGNGVSADSLKAFEYYMEAANLGCVTSLFNVARCYLSGIGVPQSFSEALAWAEKGCKKGGWESYYMIGDMYQMGEGVAKDLNKAIEYYTKSVKLANASKEVVLFQIGLCYYELKDKEKMVDYFQQAADLGYMRAKYNLALFYGNGDGVAKDMGKYKSLLQECANQDEDIELKQSALDLLKSIK